MLVIILSWSLVSTGLDGVLQDRVLTCFDPPWDEIISRDLVSQVSREISLRDFYIDTSKARSRETKYWYFTCESCMTYPQHKCKSVQATHQWWRRWRQLRRQQGWWRRPCRQRKQHQWWRRWQQQQWTAFGSGEDNNDNNDVISNEDLTRRAPPHPRRGLLRWLADLVGQVKALCPYLFSSSVDESSLVGTALGWPVGKTLGRTVGNTPRGNLTYI